MTEYRPRLQIPGNKYGHSVIGFVDQVLTQAVYLGASDVHLECYETTARLRYRLDGLLKEAEVGSFLFDQYSAIAIRIKILASLDISDQRSTQDGGFTFGCDYGQVDIRVSVLPAVSGERFVLRFLVKTSEAFDFASLGMSSSQVEKVESALRSSQGMIVVTGPTGSGKTTSLYSMINRLNREDVNILTIENPVEKRIQGVGQVQVSEDAGLTFGHALRAFLRQDPEVILIGEIRDHETADIAIKAALTGHLVLSTLHTNDAATTILRLTGLGLSGHLVNAALSLIVSQRLLRLICPHCKSEDDIGDNELLDINTPAFIGKGCEHCAYTGYKGRRGIYEMLAVDSQVRQAIAYSNMPDELSRFTVDGISLAAAGREMLSGGLVSLAEYYRVLSQGT